MPAWKTQLHSELKALGHKMSPITRTSIRPKGAELHKLRNTYETVCAHCSLKVTFQTFPGNPVTITNNHVILDCRRKKAAGGN